MGAVYTIRIEGSFSSPSNAKELELSGPISGVVASHVKNVGEVPVRVRGYSKTSPGGSVTSPTNWVNILPHEQASITFESSNAVYLSFWRPAAPVYIHARANTPIPNHPAIVSVEIDV